MEYNYLLPRKKERRGRRRKLVLFVSSSLRKGPSYNGLVNKGNSNNIKQGSKTRVETMGLERIMTLMVEDQVKEALI